MGQTLAQKLIARAAGRKSVTPGEIVTCTVDLAMMHDSSGPRRVKPTLDRLGAKPWDPDKVVIITDHFIPPSDDQTAAIQTLTREWVKENGVSAFYDMQGICHVVLPEAGHLKPGMFVVGADSHSTTGGAFGCFMFGIGATDMAGVLVTGETWVRVPESIRYEWTGALQPGVCAKDIMLALCARFGLGGADYRVVEFTGSLIDRLDMRERMTLCNMAAELGAQTGLIAPDETTLQWIREAGGGEAEHEPWHADPDAPYSESHQFDAGVLEPQIAAPHSPENAAPAREHEGVRIDQAYIGACTGAKLTDLQMAAKVLAGKKVARSTRLLVAPASRRDTALAVADGTLSALLDAGAVMLPSGCGACAGYGGGVLGEGEVCIASTSRNFQGRMGARSSQVWLGSPYAVAAAAVAGEIRDPREFI
ncbi:MAG: 3-isopropylmalate dehydratase large subunit [Alphaproteobacteria bacterium]|nr:MAG: 3-isopropylmalate dehydratase large subunit [Alphaproteobacteria bacterium]